MNNNAFNKKLTTFKLDFGGFYESLGSWEIEQSIAQHFDDSELGGLEYHDIDEDKLENIDFKAMQEDYARQYFDIYKQKTNFNRGDYVGVESPEYYNYETDTILVEMSTASIIDIIDECHSDYDVRDYIDENSQSYDGFNSYYQGFDEVIKNPAVFMNYYTRYLSEFYKEDLEYIWEDICPDVAFKETV
tara:strand:+ start:57 stop:623 length:567 start_codon:yes stop_codon:yes gene_type:complete